MQMRIMHAQPHAKTHMAGMKDNMHTHTHSSTSPLPCVAPGFSLHDCRSHLATPYELRLVGNTCACVYETECFCSVWQCVSCHDVVCTAHCSHTKLYLPRYKSLGREEERVNKNSKTGQAGDGARVYVHYYVSRWFYAKVYHVLELCRSKQVEAV